MRTRAQAHLSSGGPMGSADFVAGGRAGAGCQPLQFISINTKQSACERDLDSAFTVRRADLRLLEQCHVMAETAARGAKDLDNPAVKLDHQIAQDDFV